MEKGKLPLSHLKELLKSKGYENEGIIAYGEIGGDVAIIDLELAKQKTLDYYNSESGVLLVEKSDPITFPTSEPGRYAVIINSNDVVCSGAIPFGFLATIIAPPSTSFEDFKEIQEQIHKQSYELGISILGGHTEISESVKTIIVSGHMIGFVPKDYFIENKLSEGENIIVAGYTGVEGTGIIISEAQNLIYNVLTKTEINNGISIGNQLCVVDLALRINKKFHPSLIHDATEGGVYGALYELVAYRDLGIEIIKKPPLSDITKKLAGWLGFNPYGLISSGVLLISAEEKKAEEIIEYLKKKNIPCEIVGKVISEKGVVKIDNKELSKPKGDEIITALENLEKIKLEN